MTGVLHFSDKHIIYQKKVDQTVTRLKNLRPIYCSRWAV